MFTEISVFRDHIKRKCELVESVQNNVAKLKDLLRQPQFLIIGGGARLKKDTGVLNSKVTDMENKNS